jgi:multidrug transporter EmrE-like cation transporter
MTNGENAMLVFMLIMFGVLLNTAAQLLLKAGMIQIGHFAFSLSNVLSVGMQVIQNIPILTGLLLYVVSVIVWLMVLSRVEVSFAYPMISLGYIVNAIAAYYFFGEPLTAMRVAGIFVIIAGVYLVAQN